MFHGAGCKKQNIFVTVSWGILLLVSFSLLCKAFRLVHSKLKHTKQYFNASVTSALFCAFAICGCLSLSIANMLRSINVGNQRLLMTFVGPISLSFFGVFTVSGSLNVCMLWIELSSNTIRGLASKSNVQKSKKVLLFCSLFYFAVSVALSLITHSYNYTAILSVIAMVLISATFMKGSSMLATKLEANMQLVTQVPQTQIQTQIDLPQLSLPRLSGHRITLMQNSRILIASERRSIPRRMSTQTQVIPLNTEKLESLTGPVPADNEKRESLLNNTPVAGDRLPRRERDAKVKKIIHCARAVSANGFMFCFASVLYTLCSTRAQLGEIAFVLSIVVTANGLLVSFSVMKYLEGTPWKLPFITTLNTSFGVLKEKYGRHQVSVNST